MHFFKMLFIPLSSEVAGECALQRSVHCSECALQGHKCHLSKTSEKGPTSFITSQLAPSRPLEWHPSVNQSFQVGSGIAVFPHQRRQLSVTVTQGDHRIACMSLTETPYLTHPL